MAGTKTPTRPAPPETPTEAPSDQPIPARPAPRAKEAPRTMRELRESREGKSAKRPSKTRPADNVLREGLRLERVPDPSILTLFGATGLTAADFRTGIEPIPGAASAEPPWTTCCRAAAVPT